MKRRDELGSAADHAYFRALEEAFIRLRGAPLLLSPADWQVAKIWRREGIPLELAIRVMERIFERQRDSGEQPGIRSLRYFRTAVNRSWGRVLELGAGEREVLGEESVDIPSCLERLVAALPTEASLGGTSTSRPESLRRALTIATEGVAEEISSLTGSLREVEGALQLLDRSIMNRLCQALDPEDLAAVEAEARERLADLAERMSPEDRDRTLRLLVRRRLRQDSKLPVLSLFSREATASG